MTFGKLRLVQVTFGCILRDNNDYWVSERQLNFVCLVWRLNTASVSRFLAGIKCLITQIFKLTLFALRNHQVLQLFKICPGVDEPLVELGKKCLDRIGYVGNGQNLVFMDLVFFDSVIPGGILQNKFCRKKVTISLK